MKIEDLGHVVDMTSLVGEHFLTGVDESHIAIDHWDELEDCQCINFTLDGITYTALEDPSDGYRSTMEALIVSGAKLSNIFEPIKVVVSYKSEEKNSWGDTDQCDILEFFDAINGKKILEIGTNNTDDYYPYFVASWIPENLSVNE